MSMNLRAPALSRTTPRRAGFFGVGRLLRFLLHCRHTRTARRHLARLDDAALRDIGLTRDQAITEAARPVWDVPDHWRH